MQSSSPIIKIWKPIQRFIHQEKSAGLVLGISVLIALILANSPLAQSYHHFFEHKIGFEFDNQSYFNFSLHHWINDGLMAIFFFVVGLELKRELVAGELSQPRKALLPIIAAIGGMLVPAIIYFVLNPTGLSSRGWGIPMATDIAFALGVLYLLGNRIPLVLKVFLTALAIVDDLGAVLVIALFYTNDISITHLLIGLGIIVLMIIGNKMGIKQIWFYAVLGILGVWTAFLMSGVHATIAAVLAAFTIPVRVTLKEATFLSKMEAHLQHWKTIDPQDQQPILTNEQLYLLEEIQKDTQSAMSPLQKLEHAMHPFVSFIVLPIFALANAGVSFLEMDISILWNNNVAIGVVLGLVVGKFLGVFGFTWMAVQCKLASLPQGMRWKHLVGIGLLASIGFTMSLFITQMAFDDSTLHTQAKMGIFLASLIGGISGFTLLKNTQ